MQCEFKINDAWEAQSFSPSFVYKTSVSPTIVRLHLWIFGGSWDIMKRKYTILSLFSIWDHQRCKRILQSHPQIKQKTAYCV